MIGYWLDPRAGLIKVMRKFSPPSGIKPQAQRYPEYKLFLQWLKLIKRQVMKYRRQGPSVSFKKYYNFQHSWVWWWCFVACVVRVTCVCLYEQEGSLLF